MNLINKFINEGDDLVWENLEKNIYETNKNDTKYWDFLICNSNVDENLLSSSEI